MENINAVYLASAIEHFSMYRSMAEKAMAQLAPEQLFISPAEGSNSIAIIVQHMAGNLISRFTDFLTTDGEKTWRSRDKEFEPVIKDQHALMNRWNEGWQRLFETLNALTPPVMADTVYIRGEAHSVTHAINRQLTHHASHVGQIVYIAKMLQGNSWKSLSIPRKV